MAAPAAGKRGLSAAHREHLRGSGLSDETIELSGIYTEGNKREIARILNWASYRGSEVMVIPFTVPGGGEPTMHRVRPDVPLKSKGTGKPRKYEQPKGRPVSIYFDPRGARDGLFSDPAVPLYLTEGEKKTLALGQLGKAAVGGVGVECFHDRAHRVATDAYRLHPELLEHVAFKGRDCRIVFDADAANNDHVILAERRLAGMLAAAGAARVSVVRIPLVEGGPKGIDDYLVAHGDGAARALLEQLQPVDPLPVEDPLPKVSSWRALREMPDVDARLRTPAGYTVRSDGSLWYGGGGDDDEPAKVSDRVMVPLRLLVDPKTGKEFMDLCFRRNGGWHRVAIARGDLCSAQRVTMLADHGAPVTSNSAKLLVEWFASFDTANERRLVRASMLKSQGWNEVDGVWVFVLGDQVIGAPEGSSLEYAGDPRAVAALASAGDRTEALNALRRAAAASDYCAVAIFGALAAPLLRVLGAPNMAIHLCGDSSLGKTSMLRIALSIWGNPQSPDLVMSANATINGLERFAALMNDISVAVDESGIVSPEETVRWVYMMANGVGKTRGNRDGSLRETLSWRSVMISTGERGLVDDDAPTGARARLINVPVDGFGGLGAREVDELRSVAEKNYGFAGRSWVERLVQVPDWSNWRERLHELTRELRESAAAGGPRARQAGYWALLMVTEQLAARVLGVGTKAGAVMRRVFANMIDAAPPSAAERALVALAEHRMAHPERWCELKTHASGYRERLEVDRKRSIVAFYDARTLYLIPSAMPELFAERGIDWGVVAKKWREEELIELDGRGNNPRIRVEGDQVRLVHLPCHLVFGEDGDGQQELFQDDFSDHTAMNRSHENSGDESVPF